MALNSVKKLAQGALETAREAATSAVAGVRSVAPEKFDNAVKAVTEAATSAVETVQETKVGKVGQTIIEGATSLAENAAATGSRIARAAQAAAEAFNAEDPKKEKAKETNKPLA